MSNKHDLIDALIAEALGKMKMAEYNLQQYMKNPTAIGEHGEIAEEAMTMVDKIVHEQDRLSYLKRIKEGE